MRAGTLPGIAFAPLEPEMPMPHTVILSAARTPIGKMGGGLASVDATELGGTAIKAALERADVDPEQVGHVIMGQVITAGQGQIPSRQAQIKAGIPKEVSSETVNKVCASGLRSAGMVDQSVRAGDLDIAVAGGMESMSSAPYLLKQARFGFRMGDAQALDSMVHDGLTNPFTGKHMGEEADEVGEELEITRADMDKFALRSHELAIQATDEGRLPEEIVSVTISSDRRRPTRSARSSRSRAPTWTSSRCARTSWRSRPLTRAACPRRSCRSRSPQIGGGRRGRRGARDHARRHGQVRAALARAGDPGH